MLSVHLHSVSEQRRPSPGNTNDSSETCQEHACHCRGERLPLGVVSKDLALHLWCNRYWRRYRSRDRVRKINEQLSMEARMSICNMAIEAGARAGMIAPDEITYRYQVSSDGTKGYVEIEALVSTSVR